MYITAKLDRSECGKTDLPEELVEVLVFSSEEHDIAGAAASLISTRLIREGHVTDTVIHHGGSAGWWKFEWRVDERGEVVPA